MQRKAAGRGEREPIKIHYIFKTTAGTSASFEVYLDAVSLDCYPTVEAPPDWARLGFMQCKGCPLEEAVTVYCPVALNIAGTVDAFRGVSSEEVLQVYVMTRQRDYMKSTALKEALGSLMGLYMATSGCPVMGKLKPLVRYHLPFASLEETVFRVSSMYLMAQYYRSRHGKEPDWELKKLAAMYERVQGVNSGISKRLRAAADRDPSIAALLTLDHTASLLPFAVNETLDEIARSMNAYMEED